MLHNAPMKRVLLTVAALLLAVALLLIWAAYAYWIPPPATTHWYWYSAISTFGHYGTIMMGALLALLAHHRLGFLGIRPQIRICSLLVYYR